MPAEIDRVPVAAGDVTRELDQRLMRIDEIEWSVDQARLALIEAQDALVSVYAGLAIEPPAEPYRPDADAALTPVVRPPARAPEEPDPRQLLRGIGLSRVPVAMQGLALVVLGWCLAYGLPHIVGPERAREVVGHTRDVLTSLGSRAGSIAAYAARLPARHPRMADVEVMAGGRGQAGSEAVVIYKRSSPYPTHFATVAAKERHCLAEAIYFEARGEPVAGQIAVAQVVLNRTLAGSWPRTVCEVTSQGAENGEKCQFSYACMRGMLGKPAGDAWDSAQGLAEEILAGGAWLEEMLDATHFHRWDLKPVWRLSLVEVGRLGNHTFYNSPTENRRPLSRLALR